MVGTTSDTGERRRLWWNELLAEAVRLGVEQISDEELIVAHRAFGRGEAAVEIARDLWGQDGIPWRH